MKDFKPAVDERAALYGAILSALALAIALRLTTRRSVLKVRRGTHYHGPQLHTHTHTHTQTKTYTHSQRIYSHTLGHSYAQTDPHTHSGMHRHKYTLTHIETGQHVNEKICLT